jgi:hypothetical protein
VSQPLTSPIQNTDLLNDFIDISLTGGLTGSVPNGTDPTLLRARLGQKIELRAPESTTEASVSEVELQDFVSSDNSISITETAATDTSPVQVDLKGKVIQQVRALTTTASTTGTIIPIDDTIPQITEGVGDLSVTITPTSVSSILIIEYDSYCSLDAAGYITYALFRDSNADAIQATIIYHSAANLTYPVRLRFYTTATSGSPTTFSVRYGPNANNAYNLRASSSTLFSTADSAIMTVTEMSS